MLIIFTLFTTYYLVRSYFIKWQAVNNLILSMYKTMLTYETHRWGDSGDVVEVGWVQILTKIRLTLRKVVCSLLKGVIEIKTIW